MKLLIALVVAGLSGFIALSYEILWIRVYSFATEGEPQSFGFLLSAYLTGLALGALFARSYCQRTETTKEADPLFFVGLFFLVGNIAAFLVVPLAAELVSARELDPEQLLPVFAFAAAGLGTGFPLLSHYAIPADQDAGTRLSYLYVANIAGSTVGSLATGLWLLDVLSLRVLNVSLVLVGAAMSCLLMAASSKESQLRRAVVVSYAVIAVGVLWSSPTLYHALYEKLLYQDDFESERLFAHTVENRSGVVNMSDSGTVYGGGSYDGQMNIDPRPDQDTNRVLRAYMLSMEYLELTGRHLSPGGMIYLNSTQSTAAQKTVATVFPHALRYQNMMIAGFDPITWNPDRWRTSLEAWTIGGQPVIDPVRDAGVLDAILAEDSWRGGPTWEAGNRILARSMNETIITDDNMATEWWAFDTYP